jgi:hypothetical protein
MTVSDTEKVNFTLLSSLIFDLAFHCS